MHVGIGVTVGADQTVVAEVVVGCIEAVEVAAVSIDFNSVLAFPANGLVDEVPNETALQVRIFADDVPVFFESALRVTHSVSIFTLDERFGGIGTLTVFFHAFIAVIHRTEDVGVLFQAGLFVLAGTAGVFCLYPFVTCFEVGAVSGFITQ